MMRLKRFLTLEILTVIGEDELRPMPSENALVVSLLRMLCSLLKPETQPEVQTEVAEGEGEEPETDNSKLSRGSGAAEQNEEETMDTAEMEASNTPQTDEQVG